MGRPSKLIGSVKNRSLRPRKAQPPTQAEAESAVRTLIRWVGDDPDREGLKGTPKRVAKAYKEWFAGYDEDPSDYLQRRSSKSAAMTKWSCCVTFVSSHIASTTSRRSSAA